MLNKMILKIEFKASFLNFYSSIHMHALYGITQRRKVIVSVLKNLVHRSLYELRVLNMDNTS